MQPPALASGRCSPPSLLSAFICETTSKELDSRVARSETTAQVTPINAISDTVSGPADLAVAPRRRVQRDLQYSKQVNKEYKEQSQGPGKAQNREAGETAAWSTTCNGAAGDEAASRPSEGPRHCGSHDSERPAI
ncbi:hypothetical protein Celaphus_00013054 [Cervus elaphus hippelaphus]|uniref:Uncharacterized protein n=1 Tax=Cervus elaphus hippelaphus TaxID=46360 RepID=A0A212CIN5_CEREH|nr:hypothetical protein Celaphus_00013054 [Cervus elaphus hippelaphus]